MSKASKPAGNLPRAKDVLEQITQSNPQEISQEEYDFSLSFSEKSVDQQIEYAHLKGIQDHYKHKGRWSSFLICAIAGMLIFQSLLLYKVGIKEWDFSSYQWLIPALMVQNLAQVIGLAVWAVRYLFSDISKQRLK